MTIFEYEKKNKQTAKTIRGAGLITLKDASAWAQCLLGRKEAALRFRFLCHMHKSPTTSGKKTQADSSETRPRPRTPAVTWSEHGHQQSRPCCMHMEYTECKMILHVLFFNNGCCFVLSKRVPQWFREWSFSLFLLFLPKTRNAG